VRPNASGNGVADWETLAMKSILKSFYARIPVIRELRFLSGQVVRELRHLADRLNQIQFQLLQLHATASVKTLDFEVRQYPRYVDTKRLLTYAFQVCSQNAEDGMIQEIFRRIGTTDRTFVEIGVGDGKENNTAFLLAQGWKGYWIDGNPTFLEAIRNRIDLADECLKCLACHVTRENAASVLRKLGVPAHFDLLCLDIDQNTYYAWEGLTQFRPRVVVVEYNAVIPPGLDWKARYAPDRVWDGSHNFGASLKAFEVFARQLGYCLVGCDFIGVNAFFVRADLVADKFAAPFTAENHYEPPRYAFLHRRAHPASILDRQDPGTPDPS
jgi:hypothetical protein